MSVEDCKWQLSRVADAIICHIGAVEDHRRGNLIGSERLVEHTKAEFVKSLAAAILLPPESLRVLLKEFGE